MRRNHSLGAYIFAGGIFGILALIIVSLKVIFIVGIMWLGGSLLTSTIKSAKGECDQRYGLEVVVDGNWFCSEKK